MRQPLCLTHSSCSHYESFTLPWFKHLRFIIRLDIIRIFCDDNATLQWSGNQRDDIINLETFSALLALCEGNPPAIDGFLSQGPVTRGLNVFFDLRLNKRLNKQSSHRWFETPSRPLWRHWNGVQTASMRHVHLKESRRNLLVFAVQHTGSGESRIQVSSLPPRWKSESEITNICGWL